MKVKASEDLIEHEKIFSEQQKEKVKKQYELM